MSRMAVNVQTDTRDRINDAMILCKLLDKSLYQQVINISKKPTDIIQWKKTQIEVGAMCGSASIKSKALAAGTHNVGKVDVSPQWLLERYYGLLKWLDKPLTCPSGLKKADCGKLKLNAHPVKKEFAPVQASSGFWTGGKHSRRSKRGTRKHKKHATRRRRV